MMQGKRALAFFAVGMFLAVSFFPLYAESTTTHSWKIETVKKSVGTVPLSMALDNSNNPHIAYFDFNSSQIIYIKHNGAEWKTSFLPKHKAGMPSLAVDSEGNPHIAYDYGYTVSYASSADGGKTWNITNLPFPAPNTYVYWPPSLALDSSGNPHLSFVMQVGRYPLTLRYATLRGNNWSIEVLDEAKTIYTTSIALDFEDHPHIAYGGTNNSTYWVKYAWFDGKDWHKETVGSSSEPDSYLDLSNMVLDVRGHPHICYSIETYSENSSLTVTGIYHAWFDGKIWHKERVPLPGGGLLALDSKGRPRIVYIDENRTLNYAWFDGEKWQNETVYNKSVQGGSMVIDKNDRVHIIFIDNKTSDLEYAVEELPASSAPSYPILLLSLVSGTIIAVCAISVWYWRRKGRKAIEDTVNENE